MYSATTLVKIIEDSAFASHIVLGKTWYFDDNFRTTDEAAKLMKKISSRSRIRSLSSRSRISGRTLSNGRSESETRQEQD